MIIQKKQLSTILLIDLALLMIPLIAMQFTDEVNWAIGDFIVMGLLLLVTGILVNLAWQNIRMSKYRIAICASIIILFLLTWAELAVGIFGTPFAGN